MRKWVKFGLIKNENPLNGNVLISVKQLNAFEDSHSDLIKKSQKKVRAVPAGARDFRKIAN